jgi:putative DNA primase/helicase
MRQCARMLLVPFPVTIPESERDHRLKERLRIEWPGILAWCISGCLEWQQHGLRACAAVSDATTDYFADEDLIAKWIDECCATDEPDAFTANSVLFREYREWALRAGEFPGTQRSFSAALAARGFERHRVGAGGIRGFRGIRVVLPGA